MSRLNLVPTLSLVVAFAVFGRFAHAEVIAVKVSAGQYRPFTEPLYVPLGSTFDLRVQPANGEPALLPDQYVWGGSGLSQTKGIEVAVTVTNLSRSLTDYQRVTVKGLAAAELRIIVFKVEPKPVPDVMFPGRSMEQFGIGEEVHLEVQVTPAVPSVKAGLWRLPVEYLNREVEAGDMTIVNHGDGTATFWAGIGAWPLNAKWGGPPKNAELKQDFQSLDPFVRKRDLDGLVKASTPIVAKWLSRSRAEADTLMHSLVATLSSYDFGSAENADQFTAAQKIARLALAEPEKLPTRTEAAYLYHLTWNMEFDFGKLAGDAWAEERKRRARQWLHCWQRLRKAEPQLLRETATPLKPFPIFEVLQKQGAEVPGLVFGASPPPELVRDPQQRAQYTNYLAAAKRQAEASNELIGLKRDIEFFGKMACRYLAKSYVSPPHRDEELLRLMNEHGLPKEASHKVHEALQKLKAQAALPSQ